MAARLDRWLGVELRHLATLHAVAEEESFRRAAAKLGYTPSAVSQQIAALERIVGVRLVDRPGGSKRVSLTEQGSLLFRYAHHILTTLSTAEADMRKLLDGETTLRVGAPQSVAAKVLPAVVRHFVNSFPQTEVELTERPYSSDLLDAVEAGDLDLAFAEKLPLEDGPFDYVELLSDPLVLLVPTDSELASRTPPLTLQELASIPVMSFPSCRTLAQIEESMRSHGLTPQFVHRSDDINTVQAMVSAGIGAALLPRLAIERAYVGKSVVELALPVPPRVIIIVWHRDRRLNKATGFFVETSRRVCAALGKERSNGSDPRRRPSQA
jgi:DNA-binding transcriptional LysR family regulator